MWLCPSLQKVHEIVSVPPLLFQDKPSPGVATSPPTGGVYGLGVTGKQGLWDAKEALYGRADRGRIEAG